MVREHQTDGVFALVEHRIPSRRLTSPVHRHAREDEYTVVQSGRVAALLGDRVVYAEAGAMIFKPRGQWHAVWNPDDREARILEIITPGGLEGLFEQVPELPADGSLPDTAALTERFGVDFDLVATAELVRTHGVSFGSHSG